MAKLKELKIPKYLRLEKGTMWFDDLSGIRLYRNEEIFIGRGIDPNNKIPLDKNENNSSEQDTYGFVPRDPNEVKTTSYFCTAEIPQNKMERILTAMNHGILVEFNPNDSIPTITPSEKQDKDFGYDEDGDVVFVGTNTQMYERLQQLNFKDLKEFIIGCNKSATDNLIDMYHYEIKGHNRLNRPRAEVLRLLRDKLNSFGPSMSPLRIDDIDEEKTKTSKRTSKE